jgi:hypothetical protein
MLWLWHACGIFCGRFKVFSNPLCAFSRLPFAALHPNPIKLIMAGLLVYYMIDAATLDEIYKRIQHQEVER